MTRRLILLSGVATVCAVALLLKAFYSRPKSLVAMALEVDEATFKADGRTLCSYIWEEERKANNLTPDKVSKIYREVILPKLSTAGVSNAPARTQELTYQGIVERMVPTPKGNVRPWSVEITKYGREGRYSLSSALLKAYSLELDASPEVFTREWGDLTADRMTADRERLQSLGITHLASANHTEGKVKVVSLDQALNNLRRLAAEAKNR